MENTDFLSLIRLNGPIADKQFNGEDLEEVHIVEAEFRDCRFADCSFDHSKIRSTAFLNCGFVRCSFKEAEFSACLSEAFGNIARSRSRNSRAQI